MRVPENRIERRPELVRHVREELRLERGCLLEADLLAAQQLVLLSEFGRAFTGADVLMLTDIYAAGEDPIPGVTLDTLADTVRGGFSGELRIVRALADVSRELAALATPGDLIVLLGAGSIGSVAGSVLSALGSKD